jgi:ADP-heptose:LPS heptosyltransferase
MAVHLAGVLGIPSLAIFGKQNPGLTKPKFNASAYIIPENICSHKNNHWRLCSDCTNSVTPEAVCNKINSLNF